MCWIPFPDNSGSPFSSPGSVTFSLEKTTQGGCCSSFVERATDYSCSDKCGKPMVAEPHLQSCGSGPWWALWIQHRELCWDSLRLVHDQYTKYGFQMITIKPEKITHGQSCSTSVLGPDLIIQPCRHCRHRHRLPALVSARRSDLGRFLQGGYQRGCQPCGGHVHDHPRAWHYRVPRDWPRAGQQNQGPKIIENLIESVFSFAHWINDIMGMPSRKTWGTVGPLSNPVQVNQDGTQAPLSYRYKVVPNPQINAFKPKKLDDTASMENLKSSVLGAVFHKKYSQLPVNESCRVTWEARACVKITIYIYIYVCTLSLSVVMCF